jgi:multidrug transporter EmrE-like cation transporter
MFGVLVGFILTLNDILCFGLVKKYDLKQIGFYTGLILPMILYTAQIPLFYYGLQTTSMTILNITWNLISNILVTLVGVFYFKERITGLKTLALWLAVSSLFLFVLDTYLNG